ncbi:hypothetical protein [Halodurantibacterium flavum]|uniref:Tail terminator n=1 Tax=Halodurantibacterium flavum TaxID=1382802 RepID=A0ABW4S8E4_9RHOB
MHPRREIRTRARDALREAPRFRRFTFLNAWAQNIDARSLPAIAVATPVERSRLVSHGTVERVTTLVVVVKRLGQDGLEDELDEDEAAIGDALTGALLTVLRLIELREVQVSVNGEGAQRVGTLQLTFELTWHWSAPLPS